MAEDILEIIEIGLTLRLREMGIAADPAADLVTGFIADIRDAYGGERYQIKRGYRRYSPALIRRCKKEYTGRNETELRSRYGLSRSSFYRLIRK